MSDETGEAIDARARLVARARSFLGPQDPNEFFRIFAPDYAGKGLEHKKAWCGIFAGACLVLEGLYPEGYERWRDGSGFVLRAVSDGHLKVTHEPQKGDLVIFGPPLWHHAIVERVEGGKVYSIDGNSLGGFDDYKQLREGVTEKVHAIDLHTTFYSIAPLVSEPARK